MRRSAVVALTTMMMAACVDGQAATGRHGGERAVPGIIDTILPTGTAIARFLDGVPAPESLSGGSPGMNDLIERFSEAVGRQDSLELMTMSVTRAEYGHFYYPSSVYVQEPYLLPPDLAWLLSSQENAKAIRRLLQRLGGTGASVRSARCAKTEQQGANLVHSDCSVTVQTRAGSEELRLFRSLLERDGTVKFLSYAGDF